MMKIQNSLNHITLVMAYRYIVTARYLDESIKRFIERLKAEGMYDDSIIVLYGDRYGISEKHNRAMAQF